MDLYHVLNLACLKHTGQTLPEDCANTNEWKYRRVDYEGNPSSLGEYKKGIMNKLNPDTILQYDTTDTFSKKVNRKIIVDEINGLFEFHNKYIDVVANFNTWIRSDKIDTWINSNIKIIRKYDLWWRAGSICRTAQTKDEMMSNFKVLFIINGISDNPIEDIKKKFYELDYDSVELPKSWKVYIKFLMKYNPNILGDKFKYINNLNPMAVDGGEREFYKFYWTDPSKLYKERKIKYITSGDIEDDIKMEFRKSLENEFNMNRKTYLEVWTMTGTRRKRSSWDENKFYNYFVEFKLRESQKYYLVNKNVIDEDDYEESLVYNDKPYECLKVREYYHNGHTFSTYNNIDLCILNSYFSYYNINIDYPNKIVRGDIKFPNEKIMKKEIRRITGSDRDLSAETIMEIFVKRKDTRSLIKKKLIKMFC